MGWKKTPLSQRIDLDVPILRNKDDFFNKKEIIH